MVDLTKYEHNLDVNEASGGGSKVEPGRHNMTFCGSEIVSGANGWEAIKLLFEIEDSMINVNYACTMKHDTSEKAVSIGLESLRKIGKAAGITGSLTDTDMLAGKTLSAELVLNEKGYLDIKDDFGNTFQPATREEKPNGISKPVEAKQSTSSEEIPF